MKIVAPVKEGFTRQAFMAMRDRLEEIARTSFPVFLSTMFPQSQGAAYTLTTFHLYLADLVQEMAEGKGKMRRAVSAPPQHGKSRILGVRAVAWLIGAQPGVNIALTGHSRALLVDFLHEVRDLMNSAAYQRIFPGIIPLMGRDRADSVVFNTGSSVVVRSAGSKLIGRRADWLIIDDPHAGRAEAESPVQRRKVIQWFFADCLTRLSPGARILLIGTRWHVHDLIGHLTSPDYTQQMEQEGQGDCAFEAINLKAISTGDGDPLGRPEGEALAPEIRPLSFLAGMRAALLGYEWDSLFMGTPRSAGGNQVDLSNLRRCNLEQVPQGLHQTRGWDLAITESQTADFTVGMRCAFDPVTGKFYLMDMFRQRMAWAKLRANVIRVTERDLEEEGIARIAMEAVSGFDAVYQEVQALLLGRVSVTKRNPPRGGKLMRAQPWLAKLEAGNVVMVNGPWNKDFLAELEQFPNGEHDDCMDATSISSEELCPNSGGQLLLA